MESNDYAFETGDEFSDLKLIVEDKVLHVHKAILSKITNLAKKYLLNKP
jgi:hypothetical protein